MSHAAKPDELLEVLGDELRAVVRDDPRSLVGESLASPLQDRLDVSLGHRLADLPMNDEPATAVSFGGRRVSPSIEHRRVAPSRQEADDRTRGIERDSNFCTHALAA